MTGLVAIGTMVSGAGGRYPTGNRERWRLSARLGFPLAATGVTRRAARDQGEGLVEADVREALQNLDPLWDELFPTEQARVLQLLIERVEVHPDRIDLRIRVDGLQSLVADITAGRRAA